MAELLRIEFVRGGDEDVNGWYFKKEENDWAFTHCELQRHFDVPDGLKVLDAVLHDRPSRDRLDGVVNIHKAHDPCFNVEVLGCEGEWISEEFPDAVMPSISPLLEKWVKKAGMTTGDRVYVQIEY